MSTNEHPITLPSEIIRELWDKHRKAPDAGIDAATAWRQVITLAAQLGADMELKACRMEIIDGAGRVYINETCDRVCLADDIWTARRPKPPSLKEEALKELRQFPIDPEGGITYSALDKIRRALEALPDD